MSVESDESPRIQLNRNVYIIGPQSTGKTTMVKGLVERLKGDVPVIQEIARHVMKEKGYSRIDVDSADPERRFAMQNDIFHAQLEKEDSYLESGTNFVSDRSAIDPLVYLMHYSGTKSLDKMTSRVEWRKVRDRYGGAKESLVVLLLPVEEFLIDDDIRYMAKSIHDWHSLAASFQRFLHEQDISAIEFGEECRDIGNRVDRVLTELGKS
jgi:nicotinamide riboside kinase